MFRRRDRLPLPSRAREFVYPRGGWRRAGQALWLRLQRLPDDPDRIARGIGAGAFVAFSPLFGLHLPAAALLAWALRGNLVAAMLATFLANPLTTPVMATLALETGYRLLGANYTIPIAHVPAAFSHASDELWRNVRALFGAGTMHWDSLTAFWRNAFLPYLVGGLPWGAGAGVLMHGLSRPLLRAAASRRRERLALRLAAAAAQAPERTGAPPPNG